MTILKPYLMIRIEVVSTSVHVGGGLDRSRELVALF